VPVRDSEKEKINYYFEDACQFIDKNTQKGGGVLVHCAYGISRSSTLVIAYLMKKLKISYSEAFSFVKRKRPMACPNRGFQEQLRLWGETLKSNR
jgi:protein-tyrosine phosphatase